MTINKKILAIIGARSGSSLKDKNIRPLGTKPLISWIIRAAKNSKCINRIVVSTDSEKYAKISKKFGAEVPCIRPKKLATKYSPEIDFIKHMLDYLKKEENYIPDIVVRLLATVPFQKSSDIDKIIKLTKKNEYDSAVIISRAKQHPYKALKISNNKKYIVSYKTNKGIDIGKNSNRQLNQKKLDIFFRANTISCKTDIISEHNSLCNNKTGFVIIPNTIDIDNEIDFSFAEHVLRTNKKL